MTDIRTNRKHGDWDFRSFFLVSSFDGLIRDRERRDILLITSSRSGVTGDIRVQRRCRRLLGRDRLLRVLRIKAGLNLLNAPTTGADFLGRSSRRRRRLL